MSPPRILRGRFAALSQTMHFLSSSSCLTRTAVHDARSLSFRMVFGASTTSSGASALGKSAFGVSRAYRSPNSPAPTSFTHSIRGAEARQLAVSGSHALGFRLSSSRNSRGSAFWNPMMDCLTSPTINAGTPASWSFHSRENCSGLVSWNSSMTMQSKRLFRISSTSGRPERIPWAPAIMSG